MAKVRIERLRAMIHEVASHTILYDLNDPRIGFVTITGVSLTEDLEHATIKVSVYGTPADKRTTMRGLSDARGYIQSVIARHMRTRTTPRVSFELDESIERAFEIERKIKEARASDPDGGKSAPDAGTPGTDRDAGGAGTGEKADRPGAASNGR
ncbi:MAG: 30S ribosome-binding factor RbfA [Planctomycetota bacterium]|nr:30S ribosome-binding factor RbfA [Planctomycetota bacterium]